MMNNYRLYLHCEKSPLIKHIVEKASVIIIIVLVIFNDENGNKKLSSTEISKIA
jgi:hypothetical protein